MVFPNNDYLTILVGKDTPYISILVEEWGN